MATVTTDFLAGIMTSYRAIFKQALDDAGKITQLMNIIATRMPSDTDKESYSWLGANPTLSEWVDVRQYKALKAYSYTLTNKHYEGTIEVDRDTYEDDKYAAISTRVRGLANRAVRHMNQLVIEKLDAGGTDTAYDSTAMFANTRTIGDSSNIDNLHDGAYSGSESEIRTAMAAVYVAMQNFTDDHGVKMGLVPDTIICAPGLYITMKQALLPGVAGTTRPEAGIFSPDRIFASPWIDADVLDWYVLCTTAEIKPLILQVRKEPEFVALDDPKSDHVFKNKTFLYGVDDRFVVGYGDPRTAIKVTDNS